MNLLSKNELEYLLSDIPDFDPKLMGKELAQAEMRIPIEQETHIIKEKYVELTAPKPKYSEKKLKLLSDVALELVVELGRTEIEMSDLLNLHEGAVIELGRPVDEAIDLVINKRPIAKGEVIVIDETFGLRITELMTPTVTKRTR